MITPSFEDFTQQAQKGNLIPIYREILADTETPVSTYLQLHSSLKKREYSFLLESVEGGENVGRFSFLSGEPMLVFRSNEGKGTIERIAQKTKEKADGDPLGCLRRLLSEFQYIESPDLPRFSGGAVGYLSYDLVRNYEPIKMNQTDELKLPDAYFVFSDTLIVFDHVKHTLKLIAHAHIDGRPLKEIYEQAVQKIDELSKRLRDPNPILAPELNPSASDIKFESNFTQKEFEQCVDRSKEYVVAGDVIQVVVSQRFSTSYDQDPFLLYRVLRGLNPSPYMFYLQFPEATIVGSSPELMVRCDEGDVEIRPIAGTRPRGKTTQEDLQLEKELLNDPKERAEHVMLVDLARNDIGRVCETSTVKVQDFMSIEKYSHVMHIVSSVVGKLKKGEDAFSLLQASFPAGTVSGAPKVRAMQIIEELEKSKRGPYAGTVCYFSYSGNLDSAITIRTLVVKDKKVWIQAGAGIVADSNPTKEYEESVIKAKALLKAVSIAKGS